jgi:hypothetical protein
MLQAGIAGSLASVQGQSGEFQRVVNWISKAHTYVQNRHVEWEFLRADVAFNTSANSAIYTATAAGVASFGEWRFNGNDWRCYDVAQGPMDEQQVVYVDYDTFRRTYFYGSNRLMTGRPQVVTQRPDQSLQFWPTPDKAYTIVGEQFRAPLAMLANDDTPIFAAKFHDVIVWRALMYYGEYEGDASVHATGQSETSRILGEMESVYMPTWCSAGPMA